MKKNRILILVVCVWFSANISNGQNLPLLKHNDNSLFQAYPLAGTTPSLTSSQIGVYNSQIKTLAESIDANKELGKRYLTDTLPNDQKIHLIDSLKGIEATIKNQVASLNKLIEYLADDSTANAFLADDNNLVAPIGYLFRRNREHVSNKIDSAIFGKDGLSFAQNFVLNGTVQKYASLTSEIASDFYKTMRLSFTANVNTEIDSASQEGLSAQQLFDNGGQLAINSVTPILYARNNSKTTHFYWTTTFKAATEIFAKDSEKKGAPAIFQFGSEIGIDFSTNNRVMGFSVRTPFAYFFGNTKFYNEFEHHDFSVLQIELTASLNSQIGIKLKGPAWSSIKSFQRLPYSIGLQVSPNK